MKKRIISRVVMMLGVVVLAIGPMFLVRAQKDSPKMPSVISTIPVIEVLELRLKDSERDLSGTTAKVYLKNNSDKTIIAFTFESGNANEDGDGYSRVSISDETGPVAGPKSDFTIEVPIGNFRTGTQLRLNAIVFKDGSSAGEDIAVSELKELVEKALKVKGRRVEPETTISHTKRHNQPLEIVSIQNSRGPVTLGQKFRQDKEWLKDLTLNLRNTSNKTIISFDVSLNFDATQETSGTLAVPFYFGMHPLRKVKVADDIRILPGELYSVSISAKDYSRLTSFVDRRTDIETLYRVSIVFTSIMFDDETGWNMNNFVRIDPTSPNGLSLIKAD